MRFNFVVLHLIISCLVLSNGSFITNPNEQFQKLYYHEDSLSLNFTEARKFCSDIGASLPQPRSQAEYDYLTSLKPTSNFWIGAEANFGIKFSNEYLDGSTISIGWNDGQWRRASPPGCSALMGHSSRPIPVHHKCSNRHPFVICETALPAAVETRNQVDHQENITKIREDKASCRLQSAQKIGRLELADEIINQLTIENRKLIEEHGGLKLRIKQLKKENLKIRQQLHDCVID